MFGKMVLLVLLLLPIATWAQGKHEAKLAEFQRLYPEYKIVQKQALKTDKIGQCTTLSAERELAYWEAQEKGLVLRIQDAENIEPRMLEKYKDSLGRIRKTIQNSKEALR